MQEVQLDKQIRLLDSPGIVFDDTDGAATALRNCVNPDTLEDPVGAIQAILARCPPETLMSVYALPRFPRGDADAFLSLAARKLGKIKKGGVPDKDMAARTILRDWNTGKVPFYAEPPKDTAHLLETEPAQVLSGLSESFNVEEMMESDAQVLSSVPAHDSMDFVALETNAQDLAMDTETGAGSMGMSLGGGEDEEGH